ncbi:MAG: prepilin-type N-terminal cleavage/methylation domain-containing protein [Candidatus Omnitrophota bacterium]|nr:type II secretion system GspH family protein [Candidatus Omnitrophota bacterium]
MKSKKSDSGLTPAHSKYLIFFKLAKPLKRLNTKKARGFTLIEAIMVIVIVGILAGGSSMYIKQVINLWSFQNFREEAVSQGRIALIRISREIRQIKDPYSVNAANQTVFSFVDYNNNTISYSLSGTALNRNSNLLISGVNNLAFSYYDDNNQPVVSPTLAPYRTNIYRINIDFQVQSGGQTKNLKTQVWPRNFIY